MKKKLFLLAAVCLSAGTTCAQDTIPALTIDSTLVVGDSANFGTNVRVGNKITVEGTTKLMDDVTASRDFTVLENAFFKGNVTTEGIMFYPNPPAAVSMEHKDVFVYDAATGQIEKSTVAAMQDALYTKYCAQVNGVIENPAWSNAPNTIFVDCPNVNVGIGTDDPQERLHIAGNELIQGTLQTGNIGLGAAPSTFSRMLIKSQNFGAGLEVNNVGNTSQYNKLLFLQFDNPSTEIIKVVNTQTGHMPFFLESNGRMTIHNGEQKILQLDTNGVLNTRTVKVDVFAWPDFVFTPTYKLRSLSEVKAFIDLNGHLPEVPSAATAETEGIDVAEMNKILLQKIEELTLYIIEQEERIKALEAQN